MGFFMLKPTEIYFVCVRLRVMITSSRVILVEKIEIFFFDKFRTVYIHILQYLVMLTGSAKYY